MCSPIVYLYYCYCTFINLYIGFPFFYACSFICASSGFFVPYMDRQKLFLKFEKSPYCFEIVFNQTLIKSLCGTNILSFYEVFNSLSLCFVYFCVVLQTILAYLLTSGNCQGGYLPPTNSSKRQILCVAFKRTKLYLVVAYM